MSGRAGSLPFAVALLLCAAAALGTALRPTAVAPKPERPLAQMIPHAFGEWHQVETGPAAIDPNADRADGERSADSPYDEVVLRTYANGDGELVQLAVAYGRRQRQEVKIHRPELCYIAQGFHIQSASAAMLSTADAPNLPGHGMHLLAEAPGRLEAVTYWIRIGEFFGSDSWAIRYHILREGLKGRVDDGVLVRASQIVPGTQADLPRSYALQSRFLSALMQSLPASGRQLLGG